MLYIVYIYIVQSRYTFLNTLFSQILGRNLKIRHPTLANSLVTNSGHSGHSWWNPTPRYSNCHLIVGMSSPSLQGNKSD